MICQGLTLKEIAHKMEITTRQVDYIKMSMFEKAECRNSPQLVYIMMKQEIEPVKQMAELRKSEIF